MKKTIVLLFILLPILLMGYTELNGDISGQTLSAGTYFINQCTVADGETLVIEAGAVLKFNDWAQSWLNVYGQLYVNGTSANKVYFTSKNDNYVGETITNSNGNPQPGDWGQIYINSGLGRFDHSVLKYGGNLANHSNLVYANTSWGWFRNSVSEHSSNKGIATIDADIEMTNSTFQLNGSYGVYSDDSEIEIGNCYFSTNALYAMYFRGDMDFTQFYGNSYNVNGVDGIYVNNGSIVEDMVWPANSSYNVIVGYIEIDAGVTCTIPAGRVIKFEDGQTRIRNFGTLDVNGTSTDPVIFTSLKDDTYGGDTNNDGNATVPAPGDWQILEVFGSSSVGEFDYCRIRYGGLETSNFGKNINFVLCDNGYFNNSISEYSEIDGLEAYDSTISIDSSTFQNNTRRGIYTRSNSDLQIDNSNFYSNGEYAAYLDGTVRGYHNNTASGNGYNAFGIRGDVTEDIIWDSSAASVVTVLTSVVNINDNVTCTIPAGTVIKAQTNGQFYVRGTMDVNGASGNPVVFTSFVDDAYGGDTNNDGSTTSPTPGGWNGIYLYGHGDDEGIGDFDHCRVRYGGSNSNVFYDDSESGYLNNCISEYSLEYGVKINESSPVITGSTFENNDSYGVYLSGDSNPDFGTNTRNLGLNEIVNNDSGNIQFYNATVNNISAYHNEWGYYNAASIDAHIYDDNENGSYGEVLFDPWFVENVEITLMTANPLDFGTIYYGLDNTLPVVIQNDGTVDLIISDVSIAALRTDIFEFVYNNLNNPIAPGEQDTIYVMFTPDAEQIYENTLSITNNSSNHPLLEVTLQGTGEYDEIPAPQNVTVGLDDEDATISWDAVTETVHGIPVIIDFYVINYNETPDPDPNSYYHLTATPDLSYVHNRVVQFADEMFYQAIAIRDYEGQYTARDNSTKKENRKITWGEFKNLNGIK